MTQPKITYSQLESLLLSFGFELTIIPKGFRQFRHSRSIAQVTLPKYAHGDKEAHAIHWVAIRGTLDDFGFLPRDRFFDAIRERISAA